MFRWSMVPMLLVAWSGFLSAADNAAPVRKATGIEKRELWTTSRVVGSPEPPSPYRLARAFPGIKFAEPLELQAITGTDRFVVAERAGKLFTFRDDQQVDHTDLLLDLKRTVYGVACHPQFATNGYVYVASVLDTTKEEPKGSRVSRYKATGSPPVADPASETIIIEWPSGGHNGGCLRFGPDGYLYLSTGDGSGIADSLETGQDVSDLLGALLRLDVDRPSAGRNYGIPADNPFVGKAGARPELYAYGLRQAWKFSFDRRSGDLWAGEIGQDLWEMVLKVEKGGNYGWSIVEGTHPFRPARKLGPTPILKPIIEHAHSDFRSITGGYVYQGSRLSELRGAYIYGDYDTGRVWSFRYRDGRLSDHGELTDTQLRIVAWGESNSGELYAVDFVGGGFHQLVKAPPADPNAPKFPRKLSETGLFTSTKDYQPAKGVIPYSVNSQLWSDGAIKDRFIALPGDSQLEFDAVTYPQPAPGSTPGWRFPDGTVLVKTFALELEPGKSESRRRIETRLLSVERVGGNEEYGDQVWTGYTYIWNDEQTDAELADSKGLDRVFQIREGGKVREQTWHFPSRAECTLCHTVSAKYALGVNTMQMNRDHDYGGVVANQLATLNHIGLFKTPLPQSPEALPKLVDFRDTTQSLDARARSYLQSNCAHCHRKWGGGNAEFQLLSTLPLADLGIVNTRPNHGAFNLIDPRVLVTGEPDRSMLFHRMTRLGLGRMPHIASNEIDRDAVELIREWIGSLKK